MDPELTLPNLKFLFAYEDEVNLEKLREQQLMFNRKDLKILAFDQSPFFNYNNWRPYVHYRQQLRYYPGDFDPEFDRLLDSGIPLHHFEENFLHLSFLSVWEVTDQSLFVKFLKKTKIRSLFLWDTFNLGQDFFDEVSGFLTLEYLHTSESTWKEIGDLSPLSRWNLWRFGFNFEHTPHQLVATALKNAACSKFEFNHCRNGELNNVLYEFVHEIQRDQNKFKTKFYCSSCGWSSVNDPNCSEDVIAGTVRHIEAKQWVRNMTDNELKAFGWYRIVSNTFE